MQFAMPPFTPAVKRIMWITGLAYLAHLMLFVIPPMRPLYEWVTDWFGLSPSTWIDAAPFFPVWQLVSWGFLHSLTPGHVLMNMLMLYFLGGMLEQEIGVRRFFATYFSSLVVAGLVTLVIGMFGSGATTIGASGAVFAVVVAMATLAPHRRIWLIVFPVALWVVAALYVGINVIEALLQMSGGISSGVSYAAHISGAAWGFALVRTGWIWRDPLREVESVREGMREQQEVEDRERLDEILSKINREGIGSLTRGERAFLKRASKRR